MRKSFLLVTILSLGIITVGIGQTGALTILKGTVVNAVTGEAITYATVKLSKNGINTMTNGEGHFIFKIPAGNTSDSIYISHIGYKKTVVTLHSQDTGVYVIRLQPEATQLTEVVVKAVNPIDLLKKAIAKIPDNYPASPYRLNGFYRLTGWKAKNIIDISEAVFDVYNESYENKGRQVKLVRSRLDKDLTAFNGSDNIDIGMSPRGVLEMDIVSHINESSSILGEQGLKEHQFTYKGIISYNGVVIATKQIEHSGGSQTHTISLPNIATGYYQLELTKPGNGKLFYKVAKL